MIVPKPWERAGGRQFDLGLQTGLQGAHLFVENINAHGNLVPLSPDDLINRLPRKLVTPGQIPDRFATLMGSKNLAISYFIPLNSHAGAPRLRTTQHIPMRHFFNKLTMSAAPDARALLLLAQSFNTHGQRWTTWRSPSGSSAT